MNKETQTDLSWLQDTYVTLPNDSLQRDDETPSVDRHAHSPQQYSHNSSHGSAVVTEHSSEHSMALLMEGLQHLTTSDDNEDILDDNDGDELLDEPSDEPRPPPYQLPSSNDLPWPKLLQYLRESEAASSRYFSISTGNKSSIHNKTSSKNTKQHRPVKNRKGETVENNKGITNDICYFCGKEMTKIPAEGAEEDEPEFCCEEVKEFCVLKAVYTKKMMEDKLKRKPGRIPITDNRVKFVKTAEERALEIMRRKQRWEENERARIRMLENSKYDHSTANRTRMIHFSLSSPTVFAQQWTEKEKLSNSKQRKLLTPLQSAHKLAPPLYDDALEDAQTNCSGLKIATTKGKLSVVCLPDNTGQYYYSSGNIAIMCITLYPSIMSYYLFEDDNTTKKGKCGSVLGYFDELGRGWINKTNSSIRFLCTFNEIFVFQYHERLKRFPLSDTTAGTGISEHLPLVFKMNGSLSIKYNNPNDVIITLIGCGHQQHKFRIKRKAANTSLPKVDRKTLRYNMELEKITLRFKSHLDSFERMAKQMKATPLPNITTTTIKTTPIINNKTTPITNKTTTVPIRFRK